MRVAERRRLGSSVAPPTEIPHGQRDQPITGDLRPPHGCVYTASSHTLPSLPIKTSSSQT